MQMYHKFMVMITMATVSLLLIFSHLDWHRERSLSIVSAVEYEPDSSTRSSELDIVIRSLDTVNTSSEPDKPPPSKHQEKISKKEEKSDKNHEKSQKTQDSSKSARSHQPEAEEKESKKTQGSSKAEQSSTQENDNESVGSKKGEMGKTEKSKKTEASSKSPKSQQPQEEEKELKKTTPEQPPAQKIDKEVSYPDWFTKGWSRTATAGQRDIFVGDQPLFPACKAPGKGVAKYNFIEPKKYLPTSKNPCWYEDPAKKENSLRCLPYFYVAGVAKCGTSDLYRRLRLHSQVMKGTMKEYHFWDRERFGNVELAENGDVLKVHRKPWTFKQYTEAIAGDRDLALLKDDLKYTGSSSKIFGDGSPSYLWDIQNWNQLTGNQGCKEPRVVIGQHIRHVYPSAKIILILRHPTPRLYSRFLSRIWRTSFLKSATSETFHNYVVNGVKMYRDCFKQWSIRHCAYDFTVFNNSVVRLVEGMYPVFVADWLRIWPKNQILLLRNEDYGANMTHTLETAFEFLGVGPPTDEDREKMEAQAMVNVGVEYDRVGPMKPETVRILDEFYQPFVEQLAQLLQDPRFLWNDVYKPSHLGPSATEENTKEDTTAKIPVEIVSGKEEVTDMSGPTSVATGDGAGVTEKPLPLWAKLLMQFKPNARVSSSNIVNHQSEEVPIMRIEKPPGTPIKKANYPPWWVNGWPRSSTSGLGDQFLGDQPFFAPCSSSRSQNTRVYGMMEPRKYEPAFKTPCWYKDPQVRDSLRCLPYFYMAGVAKSGTWDLYRRLAQHPDISRGSMKEYHWWDRGRFGDFYSDDLPIKAEKPEGIKIPFKQYTDMITGTQGITALLDDLNKTGKSTRIFGDISPSYFNDVKFWSLLDGNQGCSEPRVTIGQHIRHITPNAKIIVVIRHPTPRAYLRFLARVPEKVSVRKAASFAFHRLVKKSVNMYRACFDRLSVRHCAYNTTLYEKDKVKLWEGMYSVYLWDWLRVFPRQQIYITRYRDLIRDTRTVMAQIFKFLELPPLNETSMRSVMAEKWLERREEHELKKYFGAMVPETVDMLNDFFEPFVDKFAETLNDERFLWRDSDHL